LKGRQALVRERAAAAAALNNNNNKHQLALEESLKLRQKGEAREAELEAKLAKVKITN
jgi:hypothetical protein